MQMHLFHGNGVLLQLVLLEEGNRGLECSRRGCIGSRDMPPGDSLLHNPHFLSCFLFPLPYYHHHTPPSSEEYHCFFRETPEKLRCWPPLWVRFLLCFWALAHREAFAFSLHIQMEGASLVVQKIMNLPAMQESRV